MGITVTVDSIDTMDAGAIRRTANLFHAIADYVDGLDKAPDKTEARPDPRSVVFMPSDTEAPTNPFAVAAPVTPVLEVVAATQQPQPTVPPVPVMATPVAPPVPPAPGIDVDKNGLPWDGRIHASSRAQNADGTWRQKRGVEDALVQTVEAELRQTMGIGQPAAVPVPPPFVAPVAPPVPPAITTPDTVSAGATPIASPSDAQMTFPVLMQKITSKFATKELSQEQIQAAVASVGLPSLPMLGSRPDLVPQVAIALGVA